MADLSIKLDKKSTSDNNLIPFYIVAKQNNQTILTAWSTNSAIGGDSALIAKTSGFDNTQPTTVEVYNLGKKVNNVKISILHFYPEANQSDGGVSKDVSAGSLDTLIFSCPTSSQFYGTFIRVYNSELSQVNSGVDYRLSQANVESYKVGDASFVTHLTPNVTNNPNYITAIPIVQSAIPVIDNFIAGQAQSITGTACANATIDFWGFDPAIASTYGETYGSGGAGDFLIQSVTANSSGVWILNTNTFDSYGYFAFATCPNKSKSEKSLLHNVTALPLSTIAIIDDTITNNSTEITGTIGTASSSMKVEVYLAGTQSGNLLANAVITGTTWKITRGVEFPQNTILSVGSLMYVRQRENTGKDFSTFSSGTTIKGGQLNPLSVVSVVSAPQTYVNEEVNVTGFATGASLVITLGNGSIASTVGVDYSIVNITGGYRVTFLKENTFRFRQTKPGYTISTDFIVIVGTTRPVLAIPVLNSYSINVGGIVTVTNQGSVGYTNIAIYKEGTLTSIEQSYYTLASEVYTFLVAGKYKFVGQKTELNDSGFSNELTVAQIVTTPTPILTVTNGREFRCDNLNNGSITTKTIEVWKNGIAQTPLITTQATSYLFQNMSEDKFKIRFKILNKNYSEFSNEIDITAVSLTPIITSWDSVLSGLGTSIFLGTGVAGSTVSVYKNDNANVLFSVSVNNSGNWTYTAISSGNYKFTQFTVNKSISSNTANYTVTDAVVITNKTKAPKILTVGPIIAGSSISGTIEASQPTTINVYRGSYLSGMSPTYTLSAIEGNWTFPTIISDFGDYQFCAIENGKIISDPTVPIFSVVRQKSTSPVLINAPLLSIPAILSASSPNLSTVKIYKENIVVDHFLIDTTAIHLNGIWNWSALVAGNYQVTVTEVNKTESSKSIITEVTLDCGSLHIRTPSTDQTLFPNTITEEIDDNGIKIGIIPQTTRTDFTKFLITVSIVSNLGETTELMNTTIAYPTKNEYLYFTIPKIKCPIVGTVILIFIKAVDIASEQTFPCIANVSYVITATPIVKLASCLNIVLIEPIQNTNKLKLTLSR